MPPSVCHGWGWSRCGDRPRRPLVFQVAELTDGIPVTIGAGPNNLHPTLALRSAASALLRGSHRPYSRCKIDQANIAPRGISPLRLKASNRILRRREIPEARQIHSLALNLTPHQRVRRNLLIQHRIHGSHTLQLLNIHINSIQTKRRNTNHKRDIPTHHILQHKTRNTRSIQGSRHIQRIKLLRIGPRIHAFAMDLHQLIRRWRAPSNRHPPQR